MLGLGLLGSAVLSSQPDGKAPGSWEESARASHRGMVNRLAAVAQDARPWNPEFRRRYLEQRRAAVAALPESMPRAERAGAWFDLGLMEFRLGRSVDTIRALERALELLAEDRTLERSRIHFYLGLANLRLGEQRNCHRDADAESCIFPLRGGAIHRDPRAARRAFGHFQEVLRATPEKSIEHVAARWLTNIAHQAIPAAAESLGPAPIAAQVFAPGGSFPELPNRAGELGVAVMDLAGGAVIEDFDGDGRLDLMSSSWDPAAPLRLFLNRGPRGFEDRSREAGLDGITGGLNLVHADYDNDGDADVLVLRGGWFGEPGRIANSLLENDGNAHFRDVALAAGVAGESNYPTQTAAWADYDADGDLDLYVGNESGERPYPSQLFRNEGDGTFTDVASAAGVENLRFAKAVVWGDYDGDRDPDLYVSNYLEPNRLYRNDGERFVDVAVESGVAAPLASFPAWFWDYDNDGALDLYVSSYAYQANAGPANIFAVASGYLGLDSGAEPPALYRGDGRGGFENLAARLGLDRPTMPMGASFGDLDGDGYLDVYLGTGYPDYDGLMPNVLYRNVGAREFLDVTTAARLGHLQKGHGVAFGDLDRDGDLDLFEQMGGFYPEDEAPNALYVNPGNGHGWLQVRLVGTRSNRDGIGARIRARLREGESTREIHRTVGTGGSFGSSPTLQFLGLGNAAELLELEVFWPTSGERQTFEAVPMNRAVEIVEGEKELRILPYEPFTWPSSTDSDQGT